VELLRAVGGSRAYRRRRAEILDRLGSPNDAWEEGGRWIVVYRLRGGASEERLLVFSVRTSSPPILERVCWMESDGHEVRVGLET
jgi:hypothetical protein